MTATLIKGKEITHTTTYDPPLICENGVDSRTVENVDPPFTLFYALLPPGSKTRARYYTNCACGMYIVKGNLGYVYYGSKDDKHREEVEEGDYIYTPKGEIHCIQNLSATESAGFVMVMVGVTSRETADRIYVESLS
jgi:uncharacterized RmlC-like cupin family protein